MSTEVVGTDACTDCGGPRFKGVTYHMSRCPHKHRNIAEHHEVVAKEARRSRHNKETFVWYASGKAIWNWVIDDLEHQIAMVVLIVSVIGLMMVFHI